jgi:hypothetical protein
VMLRAGAQGATQVRARTSRDNPAAISLLRSAGWTVEDAGDTVVARREL